MKLGEEMTDAEVAATISRTDAFIEEVGCAISEAIAAVDPASPCAAEARRGLARISSTLREVDYVAFANLATMNTAANGAVLDLVKVRLMATGAGPSLDFESATEFVAPLVNIVEHVRRRRIN